MPLIIAVAYKRDRSLTKSRKKVVKKRKIDFSALLRNEEVNEEYFQEIESLMAEKLLRLTIQTQSTQGCECQQG